MRQIRTVPLLAVLVAGMAAPATLADAGVVTLGAPPPLSTLVRFEERDYTVSYDESVSLEPLSQARITKIGYGRSTEINVATTASGTYSSEGLVSPYIRYPGIVVERAAESDTELIIGMGLGNGRSSFLAITASPRGDFVIVDAGRRGFASCQMSGSFTYCAAY